ncbi:MAG: flagellar protein FlgN [Lachnospiraceae bacterium]|nr:flagellar protein FlgN [Lachnospiraceae bacterium]
MASLMEELINTLEKESVIYERLLELAEKKTPVIVKGDIANLQKITDEEQIVVDQIAVLEKKRETVTADIANVINKDVETLKLTHLIELLSNQPKEKKRLSEVHDRLKSVVTQVRMINEHNQDLIAHSLEMVEFDLNMIQAMRQAPETANYGKGGYNSGDMLGSPMTGFDAKQ